jgi:hypothetical protein
MDCTFHVARGEVIDWAEWRPDEPALGERVGRNGQCYYVISTVCWLNDSPTCFAVVVPQEFDLAVAVNPRPAAPAHGSAPSHF